MAKSPLLLGACLWAGLLLCGCGDSQEPAPPFDRTLGGVKEGAPLVPGAPDPGILQDVTTYQPTKAPGAAATEGGREATAKTVSPETQARNAARQLAGLVRDGEIGLVVKAVPANQAGPLAEGAADAAYGTFERIERLAGLLGKKIGMTKADALLKPLRGPGDRDLKVSLTDPEHATVTPNFLGALLGPVKRTPNLTLAKQTGDWKIQLDGGFSATDAEALAAYHQKVQAGLDALIQWVSAAGELDSNKVQAAIGQIAQGQPVDLASLGGTKTEPAAAPAEEKKPNPTNEEPEQHSPAP